MPLMSVEISRRRFLKLAAGAAGVAATWWLTDSWGNENDPRGVSANPVSPVNHGIKPAVMVDESIARATLLRNPVTVFHSDLASAGQKFFPPGYELRLYKGAVIKRMDDQNKLLFPLGDVTLRPDRRSAEKP